MGGNPCRLWKQNDQKISNGSKVLNTYIMAKLKSESNRYIEIHESDYLKLLKAHLTLEALKIAGIEKMDIYKGIESIIEDQRVEIHQHPINRRYK